MQTDQAPRSRLPDLRFPDATTAMRALLLLTLLVASGCTSSRTLAPDARGLSHVNATFGTRPARVRLASGVIADARALHADADTTTWIDPVSGTLQRAATADVVYVERVRRGRGAWQGALVTGLATAVVTGVVIMTDSGDWGACRDGAFLDTCDKPAIGAVAGMIAGAAAMLPGAAVGAGVSARERVRLDARPAGTLGARLPH